MKFGLNDKIMQELINVLASYDNVINAVIFGSRATGYYRNNSDIDLAIYCKLDIPSGLRQNLDEAAGIYKIDVVDMNRLSNQSLRKRIEDEGIEFYRKGQ